MRAAAQLAAAADVENAHLVAVLFAKEHHRAGLLCRLDGHHFGLHRHVGQHLGVDQLLDLADLLVAERRVVREVEARALGVDQAALLLHVRAQHFAQCLVHQVRGAVVAHGARAALGIDAGDQLIAEFDLAFDDAAVVAEDAGLDLQRVFDDHARTGIAHFAAVADLTATLGIEGRVIEHDDHVVAGTRTLHRRAVDVDRGDARVLAHQVLVAVEGGGRAVVFQTLRHLELGLGAGLFALALHRRVETGAVDRDAALAADVGRQVQREAEGVVQLERGFAVERAHAAGQRTFQDLHAVGDGLEEAFLLLAKHLSDAQLVALQLGIGLAHLVRQRSDQRVEEGLACAQLVAMADGAARDAPQHVAAAFVAGDHAVGHGEGAGADVVGNDLQAGCVLVAIARAGRIHRRLGRSQQMHEQVDLVVRVHMLQHRRQPLQAHAGVHAGLGQPVHHARLVAVELHEDVVPDLDVAVAVLLGAARRAAGDFRAVVVEDLAARAARARCRPSSRSCRSCSGRPCCRRCARCARRAGRSP